MNFSPTTDQSEKPSPHAAIAGRSPPDAAPLVMRKSWLVLLFLLAALPAVGPLILIYRYGVDIPAWDEWDIVDAAMDVHNGKFPASLFSQHNEHRIVIPRMIYCVLDNLTGWNQFADMTATLVVVAMTSLGIYWLLRSTIRQGLNRELMILSVWFVSNILIFSPAQNENWMWAVGLMNVLPMAFIVATMVAFRSRLPRWWRMGLCLVLATAATFSSGNGMLVWPLVGLLWVWSPTLGELKLKKWLVFAWLAGFAVNMGLYFHHYTKPSHAQDAYTVNARAIIHYVVAFMGGPVAFGTLVPPVTQSTVIGAVLLVLLFVAVLLFLYSWWITQDSVLASDILLWLAVAGFSVASGMMAGPTRAGFGILQGLASRYATFALYLPVGLIALFALVSSRLSARAREIGLAFSTALATTIAIFQILSIGPALETVRTTQFDRIQTKTALLLIRSLPADDPFLLELFPSVSRLKDQAERANQMGFLRPPLIASNHARGIQWSDKPDTPPPAVGWMDQAIIADAQNFVAAGWAVEPPQRKAADAVFLTWDRFDEDPIIFAMAKTGAARDDVAQALKDGHYSACGWNAVCPLSRLPTGHPLRIRSWELDLNTGKAMPLSGQSTIQR